MVKRLLVIPAALALLFLGGANKPSKYRYGIGDHRAKYGQTNVVDTTAPTVSSALVACGSDTEYEVTATSNEPAYWSTRYSINGGTYSAWSDYTETLTTSGSVLVTPTGLSEWSTIVFQIRAKDAAENVSTSGTTNSYGIDGDLHCSAIPTPFSISGVSAACDDAGNSPDVTVSGTGNWGFVWSVRYYNCDTETWSGWSSDTSTYTTAGSVAYSIINASCEVMFEIRGKSRSGSIVTSTSYRYHVVVDELGNCVSAHAP